MRILVAYGSKRGGTEGIAQMVGAGLRAEGHVVDVRAAEEVGAISGYDAVVVGGALYAYRWHRAARRFVRRHRAELAARPTYFFSSGPLDDSASSREIPPVRGVASLMHQVRARGHATFGGRLEPGATGFPARSMAKTNAGDWRDESQVRAWAKSVAADLDGPEG